MGRSRRPFPFTFFPHLCFFNFFSPLLILYTVVEVAKVKDLFKILLEMGISILLLCTNVLFSYICFLYQF